MIHERETTCISAQISKKRSTLSLGAPYSAILRFTRTNSRGSYTPRMTNQHVFAQQREEARVRAEKQGRNDRFVCRLKNEIQGDFLTF